MLYKDFFIIQENMLFTWPTFRDRRCTVPRQVRLTAACWAWVINFLFHDARMWLFQFWQTLFEDVILSFSLFPVTAIQLLVFIIITGIIKNIRQHFSLFTLCDFFYFYILVPVICKVSNLVMKFAFFMFQSLIRRKSPDRFKTCVF